MVPVDHEGWNRKSLQHLIQDLLGFSQGQGLDLLPGKGLLLVALKKEGHENHHQESYEESAKII